MSLPALLTALHEGSRLAVEPPPRGGAIDDDPAPLEVTALRTLFDRARDHAPLDPPPLDEETLARALRCVLAASRALVYRELPAEAIAEALARPFPEASPATRAFSADAALRALPELYHQARGLSPEDPLVRALERLAAAFPLSSVGMRPCPHLEPAPLEAVLAHPSLRRLYADRIVERRDAERLSHEETQRAVRERLGEAGSALAPEVADALARAEAATSRGRGVVAAEGPASGSREEGER